MAKLSFQYVRRQEPETLLAFLGRRFRYHSSEEWEELVRKGFVKVNGRTVAPGHLLETRHKIVYERPPFPEPPVDGRFAVLYEDDDIIAVEKSGNIPTSPSGKYWANCLVHVVQKALGLPWVHAVHRLDRETSGVNLLAKSKESARILGKDFQDGAVEKEYAAILVGRLPAREIFVSVPLRNAAGGAIRIKQAVHADGRKATSRFRLRAVLPGASLVRVSPLTGRTHQIRAHAAFMGFPVLGDKLYAVPEADFVEWVRHGERSSERRQLLHSGALGFLHPVTRRRVEVRSSARPLLELFYAGAEGSAGGDALD